MFRKLFKLVFCVIKNIAVYWKVGTKLKNNQVTREYKFLIKPVAFVGSDLSLLRYKVKRESKIVF